MNSHARQYLEIVYEHPLQRHPTGLGNGGGTPAASTPCRV